MKPNDKQRLHFTAFRFDSLVWLICLTAAAMLTGCATHRSTSVVPIAADFTPSTERQRVLFAEYGQWAGVPYRYGGESRRGIDCSALMVALFDQAFGESLPRTTLQQVRKGSPVALEQTQTGDLLFFKTEQKSRHVGVVLDGTTFIHASASTGVRMSDIRNNYWRSRFWQARRILP